PEPARRPSREGSPPVPLRYSRRESLAPLADWSADPIPDWRSRRVPVKPDPHRLADNVACGHEAHLGITTVPAVVAIIPHEEVLTGRNDRFEVCRPPAGNVQHGMLHTVQKLRPNLRIGMQAGVARSLIAAVHLQGYQLAVHVQPTPLDLDVVAGQPDQTLDVIRRRIRRQAKDDDIPPLGLA